MAASILSQFTSSFLVLIGGLSIWGLSYVIYNLYFHPLAKFPGQTSWMATRLPLLFSNIQGHLPREVKRLHDTYGEVVRIGPSDLSFISAEAWKDIYGHRPGHPEMAKDKIFYLEGPETPGDILTANEDDHSRFRRLLSRSFSEKALRDQEPLIRKYVDLLISRLHRRVEDGRPTVDIVSWYNWTTFDLIGDLAFGAPFDCLKDENYHFFVSNIFQNIKANSIFRAAKDYPGVKTLAKLSMSRGLREAKENHANLTIERVEARIALKTDRPDFLAPIVKNMDPTAGGMSKAELIGIANLLIIAGSETTATLLSGATYYLLRNPNVMEKLVTEVRSRFKSESEINLTSVQNLEYMLAVLDEALRIYPPSPTGLPRVVPKGGDTICGTWVPGGTSVSISQWAANRSTNNFAQPDLFIPERFLGDPRFNSDNKSAMQPFSVGPRNCVGRVLAYSEMRLILSRIIWNFDLKLADDSKTWTDQHIYTFWEKGPLDVVLIPVIRN